MADSRVSEFPSATSVAGTEEILCVQDSDNKTITPAQILEYVRNTGFSHSPAITDNSNVNSILFDFSPSTNGDIASNYTYYVGVNVDVEYNDASNASKLYIYGNKSSCTIKSGSGGLYNVSGSRITVNQENGSNAAVYLNGTDSIASCYGSNSAYISGSSTQAYSGNNSGSTNTISALQGGYFVATAESYSANSTTNVTDLYGTIIDSAIYSYDYSGCQVNATNNYGTFISIGCYEEGSGSSTITNSYGVYVKNNANGTITNHYGLYLDAFAVATTEWGIYSPSTTAKHHFAGEAYVAKLKSGVAVIPVTTTASPSAADVGTVYTNEGDSDGATITLPTAVAGYQFVAIVQVAQTLTITSGSGDTIRIAGLVTSAAGSITSNTVGSTITLTAINATEWIATSVTGIWNV